MARKPVLALDTLAALGAEKLARIVLEEASQNRAFKARIDAALAAAQGPHAVVAIVDRKLLSLEKAKGEIGWGKARAFAADLETTLRIVTGELGASSPGDAVIRLLRFLGTFEAVSFRTEDEDGRVQSAYETAAGALNELALRLSEEERNGLPALILAMSKGGEFHLRAVTTILSAHMPPDALDVLDRGLTAELTKLVERKERFRREVLIAARQSLAQAKGDLDGLIALEALKSAPDTLAIAERLLNAGRAKEALDWVRRQQFRTIAFASMAGIADGFIRNSGTLPKVRLEARIMSFCPRLRMRSKRPIPWRPRSFTALFLTTFSARRGTKPMSTPPYTFKPWKSCRHALTAHRVPISKTRPPIAPDCKGRTAARLDSGL